MKSSYDFLKKYFNLDAKNSWLELPFLTVCSFFKGGTNMTTFSNDKSWETPVKSLELSSYLKIVSYFWLTYFKTLTYHEYKIDGTILKRAWTWVVVSKGTEQKYRQTLLGTRPWIFEINNVCLAFGPGLRNLCIFHISKPAPFYFELLLMQEKDSYIIPKVQGLL